MTKLLVNMPSGEQRIIQVKQGGGFNDPSAVIWDERNDGSLPVITLGGMARSGNNLVFDQTRKDQHDAVVAAEVAEKTRLDEIDDDIRQDTVINQLKDMTKAEFNAWWAANVTTQAQANNILKRLAFREIRR